MRGQAERSHLLPGLLSPGEKRDDDGHPRGIDVLGLAKVQDNVMRAGGNHLLIGIEQPRFGIVGQIAGHRQRGDLPVQLKVHLKFLQNSSSPVFHARTLFLLSIPTF